MADRMWLTWALQSAQTVAAERVKRKVRMQHGVHRS